MRLNRAFLQGKGFLAYKEGGIRFTGGCECNISYYRKGTDSNYIQIKGTKIYHVKNGKVENVSVYNKNNRVLIINQFNSYL